MTDGCTKLVLLNQEAPSAWISVAEAAARSGRPERTIRQQCQRYRNMGRATNHGGEWRIDPTVDAAFSALVAGDDRRAELLDHREVSAHKRRGAYARRQILGDLEMFVRDWLARPGSTGGRVAAIQAFVTRYGDGQTSYSVKFTVATLYRWQARAKAQPASGLIDQRGLSGDGGREPDPDVVQFFLSEYMGSNQLPMQRVHENMVYHCTRLNKWWFNSYKTFTRWVARTWPKAMQVYNRQGPTVYARECEPRFDEDPEQWSAGDMYVGDHHKCDCFVRYRGKRVRPWLTAWMDQRSLKFVGWVITPAPNATHINAAYAIACRAYGPSRIALTDNGYDFSGHVLTGGISRRAGTYHRYTDEERAEFAGLFALVNVEVKFALPHSPQSKIIEGLFRPVEDRFVRQLPNYCGNSPKTRPHDLAKRLDDPELIPEFDDFAKALDRWLREAYNARPQQGKYCNGLSPDQAFERHRGAVATLADPSVLDLLDMVWVVPPTVTSHGIRVNNLHYGQWEPRLIAMQGQKVRVTFNPQDVRSVCVWSMDHRFLFKVDANELAHRGEPVSDEHRRAGFRMQKELRKAMEVKSKWDYLSFADAAQFAIAAQVHAGDEERKLVEAPPAPAEAPIRLIQTRLDGQSDRVQKALEAPLVDDVTQLDESSGGVGQRLESFLSRPREQDAEIVPSNALLNWARRQDGR